MHNSTLCVNQGDSKKEIQHHKKYFEIMSKLHVFTTGKRFVRVQSVCETRVWCFHAVWFTAYERIIRISWAWYLCWWAVILWGSVESCFQRFLCWGTRKTFFNPFCILHTHLSDSLNQNLFFTWCFSHRGICTDISEWRDPPSRTQESVSPTVCLSQSILPGGQKKRQSAMLPAGFYSISFHSNPECVAGKWMCLDGAQMVLTFT